MVDIDEEWNEPAEVREAKAKELRAMYGGPRCWRCLAWPVTTEGDSCCECSTQGVAG